MKEDIRVLKLSTGEDIVAIVTADQTYGIYIKKPLKIIKIPQHAEGKISVYFMIWAELKNEEEPIYINPSHVVSYYWLSEEDHSKILKYMENDIMDDESFLKTTIPLN